MIIKTEERWPKIHTVTLEGYFDYSTSPRVRKAMTHLFSNDINQIIVDFSRVDYIDSSGIATLIEGQRESKKRNIRFTLAGISSSLEAAFDLANVKSIFEIVPRVELALPP